MSRPFDVTTHLYILTPYHL